MTVVSYKSPGPVASKFFASKARRRVIIGPFGSGKSVGCCVEIFRRAREQQPDAEGIRKTRWAIVRNTYPDLKNTTVKTWKDWWSEQFGAFNNVAPFVHHIRCKLPDETMVDCEVIFLALDDEADAKKFLSLEVTGIYFNEVRELSRAVVEAGDGRVGRYPRTVRDDDDKVLYGPSWYGVIADSNLFGEDHWLYDVMEKGEGYEFFHQPGGVIKIKDAQGERWIQNPRAENLRNLTDGYYTGQLAGKTEEWIKIHLGAEFARLSLEGAYFAEELADIERQGRLCEVVASPGLPVHSFWDIGHHDYMSIWFAQCVLGEWNVVGFYQHHGKSLDHYAGVMKELAALRKWTWGDHVWPHDGFHHDVGILGNRTRAQVFSDLGFATPLPMPKRSTPGDWIDASRLFIRKCRFNAQECKTGLGHLRKYSKKKDPVRNVFLNTPNHNEHSHASDAFQIMAMGHGRVNVGSSDQQWTDKVMNFQMVGVA